MEPVSKTPDNYTRLLRQMEMQRTVRQGETDTGVYLAMLDEIGMTIVDLNTGAFTPSQYPHGVPTWAPRADWIGATRLFNFIAFDSFMWSVGDNKEPVVGERPDGVDVKLLHKHGDKAKPPYSRTIRYSWPHPGLIIWKP
jgi:hypothetical protein